MITDADIPLGEIDAINAARFNAPIPGASLTEGRETQRPYSGPAEFNQQDKALEYIFDRMTSGKHLDRLSDSLLIGVPADVIAKAIIKQGFAEGKWNPDLALMLIEPVLYIILSISESLGIDAELSPDDEDDQEEFMSVLDQVNGSAKDKMKASELPEPPGIPQGLLSKLEDKLDA